MNLAETAHQLFRIKPFTKAACSSLRIIKAALPECLGLPDDSHTAQFLIIFAIQIYICELGAHLMISTIRDPADDFAEVLGQVPIATERDRQTLESVNAILTSTNDTKSLIRHLNGMMTWTDFIVHTSAWISHTSRILDARELDVNRDKIIGIMRNLCLQTSIWIYITRTIFTLFPYIAVRYL
ncbi:hypothetical protein V1517DRAFT_333346 [Lipomyces orientalis]|uniref:Uncharacterized protein n=1 Tax=Lipomyces orientalis TaxID=1233043 RepID=A0ACC3TDZ8_9ASCO